MPEIVFPLSSSPGRGKQESGGRLVNAFTELLPTTARSKTVRRRCPGITQLASDATYSHVRGFHYTGSTLLVAMDTRLLKVTLSGSTFSIADLGLLAGTGLVTFAENNAADPAIAVVTENGAFRAFTDSAPVSWVDGDLPQPNSVTAIGGYLVFTTLAGQIYATDLNSVAVNPLSFTSAQQKSDGLYRAITFRNELFAFGQTSIEVYTNAGTSPFPLAYSTAIPRGLRGQWAVAGQQDGWSNELIWVGNDNIVYQLDGYRPVRVSSHDVERAIEDITDDDDLEASVYISGGHAIWSLSSSSWTWEFNLTTRQWHERKSYLIERWRASQSVYAFYRWIVGDRETGKIGAIDLDVYEEFGDPLVWKVESGPGSAFPGRVAIPRADFDFEGGVGNITATDAEEIDPHVRISWSDNGGATFSSPVRRELGRGGQWNKIVNVNRTGMASAKGRIWRLEVSDPVRVALYAGTMVTEGLTA